jgi:hypothetical protein
MTLNPNGELLLNTTTDAGDYKLQVSGNAYVSGTSLLNLLTVQQNSPFITGLNLHTTSSHIAIGTVTDNYVAIFTNNNRSGYVRNGEWILGPNFVDAGDYVVQMQGNAYVTGTTVLAATSGNVGVGTTSPSAKFESITLIGTKPTLGDIPNNYAIISGDSRTGTTVYDVNYSTTLVLASNTNSFAANGGASLGFHAKWNSSNYLSSAQFSSIFGGKENGTDANLAGFLSIATRPAGGNPTEKIRVHSNGGIKFIGQSAAPNAEAGTVYYDTDDNKLKVYNGTTWVDLH